MSRMWQVQVSPFTTRRTEFFGWTGYLGPNKYLSGIISDVLEPNQRHLLSMAYRKLKHSFMNEDGIKNINKYFAEKIKPKKFSGANKEKQLQTLIENNLDPRLGINQVLGTVVALSIFRVMLKK